jgi:hypothetical protein
VSSRQKKRFTPCRFLPYSQRRQVPATALVFDVSSYADPPYNQLSPFYVHGGIPIPGMPGKTSDSVEGIWQGLKVIRGVIAPRFFQGEGRKRGGKKPAGHQLGDKLLGLVEARYKIYRVAYEWMLVHRIAPTVIKQLLDNALHGMEQYFHDVEDNGDINNPESPLAHASLLVQYLNRLGVEG